MVEEKKGVAFMVMLIAILFLVVVSVFAFIALSGQNSSSEKVASSGSTPSGGKISLVVQKPVDNSVIEGDQLK